MEASIVIYNDSLQSGAIAEEEIEQTGRVICHRMTQFKFKNCLSSTIDCTADILELNGGRKNKNKKLFTWSCRPGEPGNSLRGTVTFENSRIFITISGQH